MSVCVMFGAHLLGLCFLVSLLLACPCPALPQP